MHGPEVSRKPLYLWPWPWNRCRIDSDQMSRDHSMMSIQDLAVWSQNDWLQAGSAPIEGTVLHGIGHFNNFVSIKVLFRLGRFQPLRG
jgi:hypothetical protein